MSRRMTKTMMRIEERDSVAAEATLNSGQVSFPFRLSFFSDFSPLSAVLCDAVFLAGILLPPEKRRRIFCRLLFPPRNGLYARRRRMAEAQNHEQTLGLLSSASGQRGRRGVVCVEGRAKNITHREGRERGIRFLPRGLSRNDRRKKRSEFYDLFG